MSGKIKPEDLTIAQINKFRCQLPDSELRLRHDCLVAVGVKRSPQRGGKAEAKRRVANAMNEGRVAVVKVAKTPRARLTAADMNTFVTRMQAAAAAASAAPVKSGNAASADTACTCGHAIEEHDHDDAFPGSSACSECPEGDCFAYEAAEE